MQIYISMNANGNCKTINITLLAEYLNVRYTSVYSMGGISRPNSNFTGMTFRSHEPNTYVVPTMKAMFPRIFPRHSRSRRARPMQLSRGRGETTTRKNEQFVSATKRGETAWIRSSRSVFPLGGRRNIPHLSFLVRLFRSKAVRRENDGPCLSRGIREQAAVCQGDYIQPCFQPAKEY